jgi:hypothetical protein
MLGFSIILTFTRSVADELSINFADAALSWNGRTLSLYLGLRRDSSEGEASMDEKLFISGNVASIG